MSRRTPSGPVTSDEVTTRPVTAVISRDCAAPPVPGPSSDHGLWAQVITHARCADSGLDPDQWFAVSPDPGRARQEAAAAIAICAACPVRGECLALSLRHWDIGQHGVWGGLVATDRARLRRRWPASHRRHRRTAVSAMIVRP